MLSVSEREQVQYSVEVSSLLCSSLVERVVLGLASLADWNSP